MRTGCALALFALAFVGCERAPGPDSGEGRLSLGETLSGSDTTGYARADRIREFTFPEDHGPHPDYRTEWWYVTGNVASSEGSLFGFQLTVFRSALAPAPVESSSSWATRQAYMGHFAITDVEAGEIHAFERFARGAVGLAGAASSPFRVWIQDWRMEGPPSTGLFPLRLRAEGDSEGNENAAIDLTLAQGKPLVLHGGDGLSPKGPEPGNASYYYSYPRLPAEGRIVLNGDTIAVTGLAWLDREWSTSSLPDDVDGWDWFALQLDDGWELMAYGLRREDGSAGAQSYGVLIDPAGDLHPVDWETDISIEAIGTWSSPLDGTAYPSGWRVRVPKRGWDLAVEPVVDDQELDLAFRYWEGAVRVTGTGELGTSVGGRGYVELTGYAGEPLSR